MSQIPKRKLHLKTETIHSLQKNQLDAVNGAKSSESAAGSAVASAVTSGAVSAFIGESLTACPLVSGISSAIVSGVSQFFGCW
jgi:hypothetical protein